MNRWKPRVEYKEQNFRHRRKNYVEKQEDPHYFKLFAAYILKFRTSPYFIPFEVNNQINVSMALTYILKL
jgi:hypothetical protein